MVEKPMRLHWDGGFEILLAEGSMSILILKLNNIVVSLESELVLYSSDPFLKRLSKITGKGNNSVWFRPMI
jgi:hypothetical protein